MGRILRPKARTGDEFNAFFYTLVSEDTREMVYATKRQSFLVNQGYAYHVVPQLDIDLSQVHFNTTEKQLELLTRVMASVETDEDKLQLAGGGGGMASAAMTSSSAAPGAGSSSAAAAAIDARKRKTVSSAELTGADELYYDVRVRPCFLFAVGGLCQPGG